MLNILLLAKTKIFVTFKSDQLINKICTVHEL